MAHYTLNDDGSIKVVNTCHIGSLDGPVKVAKGKARVIDKTTNARLKVSFFWPFSGDYWVLDHADDYSWSIVGHPQRKYLWILSRVPRPDATTLAYILQRVQELGYDPTKIKWEDQPSEGMLHMDNEPVESEKIVAG